MDNIQALHTAARHYCGEQAAHWGREFSRMHGDPNSEDTVEAFSRFQVLNAINEEVTRYVPEDFPSLEEARYRLADVGQTAQNQFTRSLNAMAIAKSVMQEERIKFSHFVNSISLESLHSVVPLPYHRILSDTECQKIRETLKSRWGVDKYHYWLPLNGEQELPSICVFDKTYFDRDIGEQVIRDILASHGISRVWELRESGQCYEIDLTSAVFQYDGDENYWTSSEMDWLLYVSDKSTIAFAGEWFIPALKLIWPNWHDCIDSDWD